MALDAVWKKNCETIEEELKKVFTKAESVVREDLLAAAYAAYNGRPAVVCILGTGSNSCYFDGKDIKIELPSLGFLMGDEGSGSAIGKQLVRRYFMKKLPEDLHTEFKQSYGLKIEDALKICITALDLTHGWQISTDLLSKEKTILTLRVWYMRK
jgi:N-acetylglucosamine kinase-like BadF-type ATPase